jgi:hypothetical protein
MTGWKKQDAPAAQRSCDNGALFDVIRDKPAFVHWLAFLLGVAERRQSLRRRQAKEQPSGLAVRYSQMLP